MSKTIRVGLAGLGTVGSGVLTILREQARELERRTGTVFQVTRFASRTPARWTELGLDPALGSTDPLDVARAEDVDLILELMGGTTVARDTVMMAIAGGKNVVTANKALLSAFGDEIFLAAARSGRKIGFEASVCGGIPVIQLLKTGFASESITRLIGIVNGTCNFILTEMAGRHASFESVLAEAQERGYAEADPTLDINGADSAHKLSILAMLAWGVRVNTGDWPTNGIESVTLTDIEYAAELGFTVKLIARAERDENGRLALSVHPTLVPSFSVIGQVHGAVNAVLIDGRHVGPLVMTGAGAGQMPTANAVVADMVEIARLAAASAPCDEFPTGFPEEGRLAAVLVPESEHVAEYYLRFTALDRPGVLAMIAQHLGEHSISIAQVMQHGRDEVEAVPVVILTHEARHGELVQAVETIDRAETITSPTVVMKVLREVP